MPEDARPPVGEDSEYRRVVLLGFMGSGKSTVGPALAERLGWRYVDLDLEIERLTGRTVAQIFAESGEAEFRRLEEETTARLAAIPHLVLSPGGGWITNSGLFESLPPDTLTVWLKVSPEEVLRRLTTSPDQAVRPLLQGPDTGARIEALLAQREPLYRRCTLAIDTDGRSVHQIVDALSGSVRGGAEVNHEPENR